MLGSATTAKGCVRLVTQAWKMANLNSNAFHKHIHYTFYCRLGDPEEASVCQCGAIFKMGTFSKTANTACSPPRDTSPGWFTNGTKTRLHRDGLYRSRNTHHLLTFPSIACSRCDRSGPNRLSTGIQMEVLFLRKNLNSESGLGATSRIFHR